MAEGSKQQLFPRGSASSANIKFLACARCKKRLPSGHKEPICELCRPSESAPAASQPKALDTAEPSGSGASQPPDQAPPVASAPNQLAPDWALQLSSGIPRLAESLNKLLAKLDAPKSTSHKRHAPPSSDEESDTPFTADSPVQPDASLSEGELSADSDMLGEDLPKSSSEEIEALIASVIETLNLGPSSNPADASKLLFKRHKKQSVCFPSHAQLDNIVQSEWDNPERRSQANKRFQRLYPFPQETVDTWSSPPVVDAPVSRLSKNTALPVPDASSFKDAMDKKLEGFLRSAFSASGTALRPTFAVAWVSRAIQSWSQTLLDSILSGVPRQELVPMVSQIKEANSFICEASLDAAQLTCRASALTVAARRSLWLKLWSADLSSKKSLTSLPFKGKLLFGPELDKIISQATGGKSTFLPQNKSRPSFRRGRFFRGSGYRSSKPSDSSQPSSSRGKFNNKPGGAFRSTWQPRKPTHKQTDKSTSA
eukprot:XP_012824540.1 PREDICTED: lamina-associated polypeptide 2-like [Xenopus tropicalis]